MLAIPEPSGITHHNDNLYIVSDANGTIFKTDLKGAIIEKIKTPFKDIEGIAIEEETGSIWIVNEQNRKLLRVNNKGNAVKKIDVKGKQQHKNSGLEGVCFVRENHTFYIINEKKPKQLLLLDVKGRLIQKIKIGFAKDISGISFDEVSKTLWVVSDESQQVYQTTLKGALLKLYNIPVKKAEGIAVYKNSIYVVSDSENTLYLFKKPHLRN